MEEVYLVNKDITMENEYRFLFIESNRRTKKMVQDASELFQRSFDKNQPGCYGKDIKTMVSRFIKKKTRFYLLYCKRTLVALAMEDFFDGKEGLTNICSLEQKKGYGSKLLDKIKELQNELYLEVWDNDIFPVLDFYLKNNFSIIKSYDLIFNRPSYVPETTKEVLLLRWSKKQDIAIF